MLKLFLFAFAGAAACPAVAHARPLLPGSQSPTTSTVPPSTSPATSPIVAGIGTSDSNEPSESTEAPAVPTMTTAYTPQVTTYAPMTSDQTSYAWYEDRLSTGIGVAVVIGGGVSGFTDRQMRDTVSSDVSGLWDARFSIGTHIPLGLDISYLGTASELSSFAGTQAGTLIGTTTEGALRWNILPHGDFDPYIFGGIGWQRYDVTGRTVTLSDTGIRQSDNSIEFPMGLGISFRDPSGFIFDMRGTFRANVDEGLVLERNANNTSSNNYVPMHTWEASAAVGYEF